MFRFLVIAAASFFIHVNAGTGYVKVTGVVSCDGQPSTADIQLFDEGNLINFCNLKKHFCQIWNGVHSFVIDLFDEEKISRKIKADRSNGRFSIEGNGFDFMSMIDPVLYIEHTCKIIPTVSNIVHTVKSTIFYTISSNNLWFCLKRYIFVKNRQKYSELLWTNKKSPSTVSGEFEKGICGYLRHGNDWTHKLPREWRPTMWLVEKRSVFLSQPNQLNGCIDVFCWICWFLRLFVFKIGFVVIIIWNCPN